MEWITRDEAGEVAQAARELHAVEVPELGRVVGFLEATGTQLLALDVMTPDGTMPYTTMHTILPAVVVGEDREPLYPGSELIAALGSHIIEALMREWLACNGLGGAAQADTSEEHAEPSDGLTAAERGLAVRDRVLAQLPPEMVA